MSKRYLPILQLSVEQEDDEAGKEVEEKEEDEDKDPVKSHSSSWSLALFRLSDSEESMVKTTGLWLALRGGKNRS